MMDVATESRQCFASVCRSSGGGFGFSGSTFAFAMAGPVFASDKSRDLLGNRQQTWSRTRVAETEQLASAGDLAETLADGAWSIAGPTELRLPRFFGRISGR